MAEEKKFKVTIVDDDDFLVDMYTTKFTGAGLDVDVCKSGLVLLEKLKSDYVSDIILLDIIMPGMNGLDVLREIRKQDLAKNILIVMLTNQNEEKDLDNAKELGVSGYIVKSAITPSDLVNEVLKILKNKDPK